MLTNMVVVVGTVCGVNFEYDPELKDFAQRRRSECGPSEDCEVGIRSSGFNNSYVVYSAHTDCVFTKHQSEPSHDQHQSD